MYNECIKILTTSFFARLFVYILSLPRELRRLKWTTSYIEHITRNSKYESKKLKHRNQNVISQNTMSHIGFRRDQSFLTSLQSETLLKSLCYIQDSYDWGWEHDNNLNSNRKNTWFCFHNKDFHKQIRKMDMWRSVFVDLSKTTRVVFCTKLLSWFGFALSKHLIVLVKPGP